LSLYFTSLALLAPLFCSSYQGRTQGGCRAAASAPNPTKPKLKKNIDFVDIAISNVLRDLPFSRNQPLKSVDDKYIRILKNKLMKLGEKT
jgi:hypothetical protein